MKRSNFTNAISVLVFKRWQRKNYALYSTLHKVVQISVLSVIYFLSATVVSAAAVQDTSEVKMEYDLDEIEVSAKRAPAVYSQVARVISVIDAREIEAVPAQNVEDLLEYVAGVDVRQRGAEGVQADVSIRGGTFDQTLILLNGINITDPQTGHHNLNLPVSLDQIEQIEIIEGPAARVYGPNAFSGAINIITKQPGHKKLSLLASGGSHQYFNTNVSAGFHTGILEHLVAFNRKSSSGYINNTDFKTANLFYSNQLKTKAGKLSFQSGISGKAFGANSFYTPKYPEQFEETKTIFGSLKWNSYTKLHISPVAYWRRHYDRFELFRNEAPDWYSSHNYHQTNIFGAGINSWVQSKLGKTAFGAEFRNEQILSNVLGEEMQSPVDVPGENATYTKSKSRNITSLFLEHSLYAEPWIISAGFMGNYISDSNTGINIFPGVEISYNFLPQLKVFASFNTSLRMPTYTDLYYQGPTNIGNPDLKPEKSATFESGLKLHRKALQGHIVFFYREGTNIIDWTKENIEDIWQPRNITELNSFGTEARLQLNLQKYWGKKAPEKISLNYYFNHTDKKTADFISNYVLDNIRHKLVLAVNQNILDNFYVNIRTTYQDREGAFTYFENQEAAGEKDYAPFWLVDLKAGYNYQDFTFFVSANNLFDKKYYDIGNVLQPGRWLKAGAAYTFNFD